MPSASHLRVAAPPDKPLVLYDGDCRFCGMWARRWTESWSDRLDLQRSQDKHARFPEIPAHAFAEALQLIDTDGSVYSGAEAVFRSRSLGLGKRDFWLWCYQCVPGAATGFEFGYRIVARHRPLFSFLTRWLWGESVNRPRFAIATEIFLRLLAVTYLIAFLSFWLQLRGLIGPDGILPAENYLRAAREQLGPARWLYLPSLCWLLGGGTFLHVLCAAGLVLSVAAFFNLFRPLALFGLWAAYLSLAAPGQIFLSYQWDTLLLEAGFLSFFLAAWGRGARRPEPPRAARWLLWWLLIRLMLLSGAVKLASGDALWSNLSALTRHYETQPLPTWIGWWAWQLPGWFHRLSCAIMFAIELGAPLLLLGPRRLRLAGAVSLIGLQVLIALTGNYTFFNLLTIALCLLFLDDAWWNRWRRKKTSAVLPPMGKTRFLPGWLLGSVLGLVLAITTIQALPDLSPRLEPPAWLDRSINVLAGFRSLNNYGLFAVMTPSRPEIVIEGSNDGRTWEAYEFKWKPGALDRRPGFVAPHQPRLDWQLWFAALAYPNRERWVLAFMQRLLEGAPAVLGLIERNPFPSHPPRYLRAVLYDYQFTTIAEHARDGNWWRRSVIDYYVPPINLR
jgi:lipase maturation factor 1